MMGDNKSEKFFKVLHDRMKEAQTDIKATVSVNVGEMTYKANEKELETGKTRTQTRLRALVASVHHAAPLAFNGEVRICRIRLQDQLCSR